MADFRELAKDVKETWDSISQVLDKFDWDFFSTEGAVKAQGYEILDDVFRDACTKDEAAADVANEIGVIKNRVKNLMKASPSTEARTKVQGRIDELLAIGTWLIDYVRANFEEEIVKNHSQFRRNYLKG